MKEKKLIALNQNFENVIKEFPNFEEQVNKKIHSTIKKMIDRGERFENINCLINYMIAGGRYVTSYFKSQVREYCSAKYEEHRDYHTILSDYKEDKFFLNYKEYEVENGYSIIDTGEFLKKFRFEAENQYNDFKKTLTKKEEYIKEKEKNDELEI